MTAKTAKATKAVAYYRPEVLPGETVHAVWIPNRPVPQELLQKGLEAISSWYGVTNARILRGMVVADELPRVEAARSSLDALVEGINIATYILIKDSA